MTFRYFQRPYWNLETLLRRLGSQLMVYRIAGRNLFKSQLSHFWSDRQYRWTGYPAMRQRSVQFCRKRSTSIWV